MAKLVITADDVGISPDIDQAAIAAATDGRITAISLIPGGSTFEQALNDISAIKKIDIGIHISLSQGKPLSDGMKMSRQGTLPSSHGTLLRRYLLGYLSRDLLLEEICAQIKLAKDAGIEIAFLNTHQHVQLYPFVLQPLCEAALRFGIRWIRLPFETHLPAKGALSFKNAVKLVLGVTNQIAIDLLQKYELLHPDVMYGLYSPEKLSMGYLKQITDDLAKKPSHAIAELCVHIATSNHPRLEAPWSSGFVGYRFQDNYRIITGKQFSEMLEEKGIQLASFSDLST